MAAQQQRRHHNGILTLAIIIAIVAIITGGLMIHHHNDQQQMKEIVYSKEAKKIYMQQLRIDDPRALTPHGIIHSYSIDDSSIKHNPMGSIMVTLIINNDSSLTVQTGLTRYWDSDRDTYGPLQSTGGDDSPKLVDLLEQSKQ